MKALVYAAPSRVEVRDVPEPQPRDHAAKVRMRYCGVCGTDIAIHAGKHPRAKAPLVIGHEFVGVIEEVRGGTRGFKPGDRVVAYPLLSCGVCLPCRTGTPHVCEKLKLIGIDCDGGMAGFAWVDEDVLFKVDDALSDRIAALIEPLAVIVRSLHQSRSGASRIVISDIDEARLGMCHTLGYETVNGKNGGLVNFVNEATKGEGMDVVFECSGVESAALEVTKLARVGGTICMTGIHKAPHPVDLREINFKEQTLVGSRVYTKREFEQTVSYAAQIRDDLEHVVTQIIPLTKSAGIFDMIADPAINTLKVLVDCTA
jgi:threonine dehydrogenase-like Zn-dependent dehydrogenase